MSNPAVEVLAVRLEHVERDVEDHEGRLRVVEVVATRVVAYATLGSVFGGGIVAAVLSYLLKR